MSTTRRDFLATSAAVTTGLALGAPLSSVSAAPAAPAAPAAQVGRARPVVVSDYSGFAYRNGGADNAVERAFRGMTGGEDVLEALIEGVTIPELDPTERGIGYGALPNADGVVQLDASCMHGPTRRAGGVAAIEGVRTPSRVAKAVLDYTDHHLLVGAGAQAFARMMGFTIEDDLNTDDSRRLWREWKRRVDPAHWLDPDGDERKPPPAHERDPGDAAALEAAAGAAGADARFAAGRAHLLRERAREAAALAAGRSMVRDGLIAEGSFWGTISCVGLAPDGGLAGVTTTSGLAWKIPGRTGDSPILGAGMYVDNAVGAAGSTGRGEANLYNLSTHYIVERLRAGDAPKDAGLAALRRIRENTVEARLRNGRGEPNFNVRFFVVNAAGDYAGVAMYRSGETRFAVCTENGAEAPELEPLLDGGPGDA